MYGAKKVTLRNSGEIVLSGNKTWHPIGRYFYDINTLSYSGWFLKNTHQWERSKTDENSITFSVKDKGNIRKEVLKEYPEQVSK